MTQLQSNRRLKHAPTCLNVQKDTDMIHLKDCNVVFLNTKQVTKNEMALIEVDAKLTTNNQSIDFSFSVPVESASPYIEATKTNQSVDAIVTVDILNRLFNLSAT